VYIVAVEHRTHAHFTQSNPTTVVRYVTDYPRQDYTRAPSMTDLVTIATRNAIRAYALSTKSLPALERQESVPHGSAGHQLTHPQAAEY
jgi:hypothetical protein